MSSESVLDSIQGYLQDDWTLHTSTYAPNEASSDVGRAELPSSYRRDGNLVSVRIMFTFQSIGRVPTESIQLAQQQNTT